MQNSLASLLVSVRVLPEPVIAYICKEVLQGVSWLHKYSRVHRDIKSENILYDYQGHIKLSDFGVSAQLTKDSEMRTTIVGTPSYMAPEIVVGGGYGTKVDVWSLGIMTIEMAQGELPFRSENKMETLAMISNSPPPVLADKENWSEDFHDFIAKCFEKNPIERAAAEELLRHNFVCKATKDEFMKCIQDSPRN